MFKKVILVAEDDIPNQTVMKAFLENKYKVILANDGVELFIILKNAKQLPDLILLDIRMPNKNGYQVLMEMCEHPQWQQIPVIIVTGEDDVRHLTEHYCQIEKIHHKPVHFPLLLNDIEKILKHKN